MLSFQGSWRPAHYGQDALKRYRATKKHGDLLNVVKRIPRTLATILSNRKMMGVEKGYVHFQDFVPDNDFDTHVTVVGDRAFAYIRNVRPGDFRASGSGDIVQDINRIDRKYVEIAFDVMRKVGSQSMAFDFVSGEQRQPFILEVSYCYIPRLVHSCPGILGQQVNLA